MNILSSILIALSLSMDNLAVSVASGSAKNVFSRRTILQVSCMFAAAHFVMFTAGFVGGYELTRWLGSIGRWVACAILLYIGGHMIWESFHGEEESVSSALGSFSKKVLLSFATSMDALFVGMGVGLAGGEFWLLVVLLTGFVFVTSAVGFYAGRWLGSRFGRVMERVGGAVLIYFGVKLLL